MRRKILSKLIVTLTIIILPGFVWADFGTRTNIGTGVDLSSIALGDIDNDGDLDLIVTGYDGSGRRLDKYINNGAGSFSGSSFGTGVYQSSIALGDIDNDGDLDLIVTGYSSIGRRLDRYRNLETTLNNKPNSPTGMSSEIIGGYWRFKWNAPSDDHTPTNMIRYKVAYGTNSGVYNFSSTNIDYPRG